MGKNRIKALRKINVNDKDYVWNVSNVEGQYKRLKVWKDKIVIFETIVTDAIKPSIVKDIILNGKPPFSINENDDVDTHRITEGATSIIDNLEEDGDIFLTNRQKQMIIDNVYNAIRDAKEFC
tara:strand:+ start:1253 stop:1621 length:369 start_codon:yes stop_codon:yes gene_type:complete